MSLKTLNKPESDDGWVKSSRKVTVKVTFLAFSPLSHQVLYEPHQSPLFGENKYPAFLTTCISCQPWEVFPTEYHYILRGKGEACACSGSQKR